MLSTLDVTCPAYTNMRCFRLYGDTRKLAQRSCLRVGLYTHCHGGILGRSRWKSRDIQFVGLGTRRFDSINAAYMQDIFHDRSSRVYYPYRVA